MLSEAIKGIVAQKTEGMLFYDLVVVDNDRQRSAEKLVRQWQRQAEIMISYDCQPEQNISLARNRAVKNAKGNFIAFIDDDEVPEPDWLLAMLTTLRKYNADGVLGPVVPLYQGRPPEWLIKSGLCLRTSFHTGARLENPVDMRTGNVLFRTGILDHNDSPFDARFGRTGGEDTDFFARMLEKNYIFVWCEEAVVFEHVPPERQAWTYYTKRALVRGMTNAAKEDLISVGTFKSLAAVLIYSLSLPFTLVVGFHVFIRYFVRNCDHIGKLMAQLGLRPIKERDS
jgi:succinoglycan biosynthesis protein ExoM